MQSLHSFDLTLFSMWPIHSSFFTLVPVYWSAVTIDAYVLGFPSPISLVYRSFNWWLKTINHIVDFHRSCLFDMVNGAIMPWNKFFKFKWVFLFLAFWTSISFFRKDSIINAFTSIILNHSDNGIEWIMTPFLPCTISWYSCVYNDFIINVSTTMELPYFISSSINTLTANYGYSRSNTDNLPLPVQIQLSEKLNNFLNFIAFLESALNFEHFGKKMSLIAQVFLKLLTPKDVFT